MNKLIVALDFDSIEKTLTFVDTIDPSDCRLKVGKELFCILGTDIIKILHKRGFEVFLDLKFFDIPNTVASAVHAVGEMGVWMTSIHAHGGSKMMYSANYTIESNNYKTLLVAVTMLTSITQDTFEEIGYTCNTIELQAIKLAQLSSNCGINGIVSSPIDAQNIKNINSNLFVVSPGIRVTASKDDQNRTYTVIQALENGVDYLVIGRPVTRSQNPLNEILNINNIIRQK